MAAYTGYTNTHTHACYYDVILLASMHCITLHISLNVKFVNSIVLETFFHSLSECAYTEQI